ncbi:MAG: AAA family ATPase [Deltaproteobacteria bacterium]|nr:AAA family ATPase [Deltaproteobacteria bacterium]
MYKSYFNLTAKPFDLLPDPRFIYLSKSHKKALTYLDYGIMERSGFVLLTGEVGSGKTTLIRDLLEKRYEQVVVSKIFNTRVTSEQLLAMVNEDFGLAVQGKDKVTLIRDLNEFLIDQYASGTQPVLIIDEAQNLSGELLEEVRMLSNLEATNSKLLQIILVGQPELRATLAAPELRQLRQRININCHLQALTRAEIEEYIVHRLEVAGNIDAVHFTSDSFDAIFRYSRGIPRLINIICDFLMLSAFADETTSITIEMIHEVIGELDFENYYWAAAADEQEIEPDSILLPVMATLHPSIEQQNMFADILRRIESIEHTIDSQLHSALKGQNDRFNSFQATVQSHIGKTNSNYLDLNRKLEKITDTVNSFNKGVTYHDTHKKYVGNQSLVFNDTSSPPPK